MRIIFEKPTSLVDATQYGLVSFESVYDILRYPVLVLIVLVLGFNLTQRNHLEHGERKRLATLGFAILILAYLVQMTVIRRFALPEILYLVAVIPVLAGAYVFRSKLFIFRKDCSICGRTLPPARMLYYDSNTCAECEESAAVLGEAGARATQFPEGVPESVDEIDWSTWRPDEEAVLCFIRSNGKVLLIRKKRGLGAGKINAPGGRIEKEESALDAAIRETQEEVCVTPVGPRKRAELFFVFTNGYSLQGSVYSAEAYSGEPSETDEATPFWCRLEDIPYDQMWEDDSVWLPRMLSGEQIRARFIFEGDKMTSKRVESASFDEE